MPTQTLALTLDQAPFVRESVESGDYNNACEVVREALRLFKVQKDEQRARVEYLRGELQEGYDDYEAGRYIEISTSEKRAAYFEDVNHRGTEQLAK